MNTAAFRATYSDWKVVKGRKVVQVVLEMPLETADTAYQVLGGMPSPAAEVWCAVARLNEVPAPSNKRASSDSSGEREPESDPGLPAERGHKSPAQISGFLCTQVAFQRFLSEKFREVWMRCDDFNDQRRAANVVRELCQVDSRADIKPNSTEWLSLMLAWKLWNKEAEVVPA